MDYGYQLLRHVVQQVFGNLWQAARLTLPPFMIPILLLLFGAPGILTMQTTIGDPTQMAAPSGTAILAVILAAIAGIVAWLWAAVAWHRFILKSEYPSGFLPPWNGGQMASYLGRSLLIGLVLMGVGLGLGIVLLAVASASPFGPLAFIVGVGGTLGLSWVAMRLGLILPAAAIGEKMTLGESWTATRPVSGQILLPMVVIAIVFTLLGQIVLLAFGTVITFPEGMPVDNYTGPMPRVLNPVGQIVNMAVLWVQMLINLAVLTTLYGNLIEGRQLN